MAHTIKQTVLVTGATSGIGLELAKLFAQDGYDIVHVARNEAKMTDLASDLGMKYNVEVTNIVKDLSQPGAAQEVYREVKEKALHIDILVNNVGAGIFGKFQETDLEEELGTVRLNIDTTLVLTKLFLQDMLDRNAGKILNLASMVSKIPSPFQSVYAGTKAFVYNFSQSLASELKDTGVTVTALRPGATETDFFRESGQPHLPDPKDMDDPAQVAKDGYEALMKGETAVVSGFQNKVMAHLADVLPDEVLAEQMAKRNEKSLSK